MAGIGIRLQKFYEKKSILAHLAGFGYSMVVTIAPMFLIIGNVMLMSAVLGYDTASYTRRGLFSSTLLYIFIFSLLTSSPFNGVLSRYLADVIYDEHYDDILPCFDVGILLNVLLSCGVGIPFCIWECVRGHVNPLFVFTGFCGFISLVFVFYAMLYLSVCKDYQKITLYFFIGMAVAFGLSLFFVKVCHRETVYSMLLSLTCGFFIIAVLELATVKQYFKKNSNHYRNVLSYFRKYWMLVVINILYILGLYIHNFVFWGSDMQMKVANSFVFAPAYDLATCLAMFTTISATIIFISHVEMYFHKRYKAYSEAVIGGRWEDIENTKTRMFRQLASELLNLVRVQFIISIGIYLFCIIVLPHMGVSGRSLQIYPCLAVGYFVLFLFYSEIVFLYYFNDLTGALLATSSFCVITFVISRMALGWDYMWYGLGVLAGSFVGFTIAYFRIRWAEKHMDEHIFCTGLLFPIKKGKKPDCVVYKKNSKEKGE